MGKVITIPDDSLDSNVGISSTIVEAVTDFVKEELMSSIERDDEYEIVNKEQFEKLTMTFARIAANENQTDFDQNVDNEIWKTLQKINPEIMDMVKRIARIFEIKYEPENYEFKL